MAVLLVNQVIIHTLSLKVLKDEANFNNFFFKTMSIDKYIERYLK